MSKSAQIFDPDLLEVLLSIAETRSFTETARWLKRSQSSVSTSIRKLEEAVGCELVRRSTHSVLLTNDGEEMVRYARIVHGLAEEAQRRFAQPNCAEKLRFGVFTNFDSLLMVDALKQFNDIHPAVQVSIETYRSDLLLSRFRDGLLDIILATKLPGHGFGTPVWQDDLIWIGTRRVPEDVREPVPLAVREKPSMLRRVGVEALNVSRRPHLIVFEGNNYNGIVAAVNAGLGFSVFPRLLRPKFIPEVEQGLPALGHMDYILLRSERERRQTVDDMYDIISRLSPRLFEHAAAAMFGGSRNDASETGAAEPYGSQMDRAAE